MKEAFRTFIENDQNRVNGDSKDRNESLKWKYASHLNREGYPRSGGSHVVFYFLKFKGFHSMPLPQYQRKVCLRWWTLAAGTSVVKVESRANGLEELQALGEMDSYVPNNPDFGCEPCAWQRLAPPGRQYTPSPEPDPLPGTLPGPLPGTCRPDPPLHTCCTPDPMLDGLSFGALDFEPLPHVCTTGQHRELSPAGERSPSQDMNDFFFPMKHHSAASGAVVSGGVEPCRISRPPTARPWSLRHDIDTKPWPHGPLSPNGSSHLMPQNALTVTNHHGFSNQTSQHLAGLFPSGGHMADQSPQMFPSMSVNVSMNMNIGVSPGYQLPEESFPPQLPWSSSSPQYPSAMFSPQPPLVSPLSMPSCSTAPYSTSASYAFTADLRPEVSWSQSERNQQLAASFRSLRRVEGVGYGGHLDESLLYVCKTESPSLGPLDKTNICNVCGKAYARPSTLKTHMRTHSGERPYKCHECNKSFSQAANLTAHVRTHSGEKPFCCPICDRRFSQSSSVTTHMRTHSGDRPYRCRMCKKSFSDSSTLTKHMRIHSGEKPYQCRICLLRFSQSGNLNRHMRVHASGVC